MDQRPGEAVEVAPGVRRVLAPNPSPLTGPGTNSYLIGRGELAVVDPGPDEPRHLEALTAAAGGERVALILVTHAHLDHSALAPALAARTGAPVAAFGDARAGRSPAMAALAGGVGGGEGVDAGFAPDRRLADGEAVEVGGARIEALHTPGHMGNHLAFAVGYVVLTGDLVMGWASTLVSPPDGDVAAFMASCERLRGRAPRLLLPGHGDAVADPAARIDWLLAHRRGARGADPGGARRRADGHRGARRAPLRRHAAPPLAGGGAQRAGPSHRPRRARRGLGRRPAWAPRRPSASS